MENSCGTVLVKQPGEIQVQSKVYAYQPGNSINVDLADLLGQVPKGSPGGVWRICGLRLFVAGDYTTGAGNSLRSLQLLDTIDQFTIADRFGPRVECLGREVAISNFIERMHRRVPAGSLAVNVANQLRGFCYYFPIDDLYGWRKESETWWDLADFETGTWTMKFGGSNIGDGAGTNLATVNSTTTVQWFVDLVQEPINEKIEGNRSRKIRTRWAGYSINSNQQTFAIGKDCVVRWAGLDIGRTAAALTAAGSWTAANTLDSTTFGYASRSLAALIEQYRDRRQPENLWSSAADDTNPFLDGTFQPLWTPRGNCSLFDYPVTDAVQFRTSQNFGTGSFTAANGPRILIAFVDNDPVSGAACTPVIMKPANGPNVISSGMVDRLAQIYKGKMEAMIPTAQTLQNTVSLTTGRPSK